MKNELATVLFSRRSLTDQVARQQIGALCEFGGGLMCPDKASESEPIRTPFDPFNIDGPLRWLTKPHGEFFYRKGKPVQVSGEMWNLANDPSSHFPSPLFSNYWTGQIDGAWALQIGIERVENFVFEMVRATGADFALLTTRSDLNAKNQDATMYSYQGLNLESGIPGLYWVNFFSDKLAKLVGLSSLPKEIARSERLASGTWMLKFCELPDECRNVEVLQRQRAAIEWLGHDMFFDIRFPSRKLTSLDWGNQGTE